MAAQKHRAILGETIRRYRKEIRLSQERLAEKANVSTVFIGSVERGVGNISVDTLTRIAKALKVTVNDLTKGF